jgi:hypothetical protein
MEERVNGCERLDENEGDKGTVLDGWIDGFPAIVLHSKLISNVFHRQ